MHVTSTTDTPPRRGARRRVWRTFVAALALAGLVALPAVAQDEAATTPTDARVQMLEQMMGRWQEAAGRLGARGRVVTMPGGRTASGPMAGGHGRMMMAPGAMAPRAVMARRAGAGRGVVHEARGGAFERWLDTEDRGPLVPGLLGALPDGTRVRLAFSTGDPAAGGTVTGSVEHVVGEGDLAAFRQAVREAAQNATHEVVDVVGRTVEFRQPAESE